MRIFQAKEVLQLCPGLKTPTLNAWCGNGVIKCVGGGHGHGNHRLFSVTQTVGIIVGYKIKHETKRGCVLSFVEQIVGAFTAMTEEELQAQLREKGDHFVTIHAGRPILQGRQHDDQLDVAGVYERVAGANKR